LHILNCIDRIDHIKKNGDIVKDYILYDATLRNLQTLSESTSHIPQELKSKHTNIDWKKIIGFRNVLVHDYLGEIDSNTVLNVINNYLPVLRLTIQEIIKDILDE
jgi:uncharacterized protein with HEPN domain